MDIGFNFRLIWHDNSSLELRISAWNGAFGGVVDLYEAIGNLKIASDRLRGFPKTTSDKRDLVFGSFDRKYAGGAVRMLFHCIDGSGHAFVEATIDAKYETGGTVQTVLLAMPVEATAIDKFVVELERIEATRSGTAHLRGNRLSRLTPDERFF
jgi:hypothetical protein